MSSLYVEYLSLAGSGVRGVDRLNGVPATIASAFPFTSLLFGDGAGGGAGHAAGDAAGDAAGGAELSGARESQRGGSDKGDSWEAPSAAQLSEGEMSTLRNMWLGIGPTIGRLHFDPFENLLAVIRGRKDVVLFDPSDNAALHEGHMREAMLEHLDDAVGDAAELEPEGADELGEPLVQQPSVATLLSPRYSRAGLSDSTSMVNSPLELNDPAAWGGGSAAQRSAFGERFPLFAQRARPLRCTVRAGETLYIPSWWWHEVASTPAAANAMPTAHASDGDVADAATHVSLNFWWSPAWTKPFPCAACELRLNVDDAAPVEEALTGYASPAERGRAMRARYRYRRVLRALSPQRDGVPTPASK